MSSKRQLDVIATIFSTIFILAGILLIVHLSKLTSHNNEIIAENQFLNSSNSSENLNENSREEEATSLTETELSEKSSDEIEITEVEVIENQSPADFNSILESYQHHDETSKRFVQDLIESEYQNNALQAQDDIMDAITQKELNYEQMGALFLPEHPAQETGMEDVSQIDVPLLLQKDPAWHDLPYGSNTTGALGENGCAIVSLAMVHANYTQNEVLPADILQWSRDNYYVHNQGTSWTIFYDFAQHYGYQMTNFGNDFYTAMEAVNNGQVIVASVAAGYFTEVGHILVIRGYEDGKVYVNDPNDDPSKMFSLQGIDESIFLSEGLNYWAFYQ